MREVFLAVLGVMSTAAFLSLSFFVAQVTLLKKSDWLYERLFDRCHLWRGGRSGYPEYSGRRQEIIEKSYCYLAIIGFMVCIFAGTHLLLWWIPNNWGWPDNDGAWQPLWFFLAFLSALFIGSPLIQLLMDCIQFKMKVHLLQEDLQISRIEIEAYRSLVEYGDDLRQLEILKLHFEEELKKLVNEKPDIGSRGTEQPLLFFRSGGLLHGLSPKSLRFEQHRRLVDIYSSLIDTTKGKIERLASSPRLT